MEPLSTEPSSTSSQAGQQAFGRTAPYFAELTDRVLFDDNWQRPQLCPRDRSLITVAALVAMNRTAQLPFHLQRALDNGVTRPELSELFSHLAFYAGWPCAASAAGLLGELPASACQGGQ